MTVDDALRLAKRCHYGPLATLDNEPDLSLDDAITEFELAAQRVPRLWVDGREALRLLRDRRQTERMRRARA